jgi:hypothetical protein
LSPFPEQPSSAAPWPGEAAAERLRDTALAACAASEGFPAQLEAALRAALRLLAAEPETARLLLVFPVDDELGQRSQRRLLRRFAALMRHAAKACPRATLPPFFIEPHILGAIRFQVARMLEAGEASQLERLVPDALRFLLPYYYGPEEARWLAQATGRVGREPA